MPKRPQLKLRHIFVFGSNRQGRHGLGAALTARNEHGAIYGQARGLQGNSYAIVTKELRQGYKAVTISEIALEVAAFLDFAAENPEWIFDVAPIGCGLAGFVPSQIAPLFNDVPSNVRLPPEFQQALSQ